MTVTEFPQTRSGSSREPQLPQDRVDSVRNRLQKHLDDNEEISQVKVAKSIGKSAGVISLLLKGTYTGNVSAVARDVERYLETFDRRRAASGSLAFARTSIARRIEQTIEMAEAARKIAIIATDSGVGATETLRNYTLTHPGVVLLECDPATVGTPWALLTELLAVVTNDGGRLRPADATRAIVKTLSGTDRTILVDEAHYLSNPKCVDVLRRISDRSGVGLVLCGNASTYQGSLGGSSMLSSTSYTQFQRRSIRRMRIKASEIKLGDLRLVLSQMIEDPVLTEVLPKLEIEAHERGGIGRVVAIIQVARMLAKKAAITRAHVLRAISVISEDDDLGGEE
jgi:DNA transposition AAA+ family ATPase